uniref:Gustatory and odorant receptor 24 n=1 Tax=Lygus hesperus TaxID=30085 RepID=A0A0A9X8K2_LYGHE
MHKMRWVLLDRVHSYHYVSIFRCKLFLIRHLFFSQLGDTFLRTLMGMDKHSMSHESIEEVNNFMNTIAYTDKAKITLKNYINIGRPLLVTLLSTSVTYLVVLLQFHSSAIDVQMSSDNTTAP